MIRILTLLSLITAAAWSTPAVYANLSDDGRFATHGQLKFRLKGDAARYTPTMFQGHPAGTQHGIAFHFYDAQQKCLLRDGTLYYALIDLREPFPTPKFKRFVPIGRDGRAEIRLSRKLSGKYDFIDWEQRGEGDLLYRLEDRDHRIVYEGVLHFTGTGPFHVDPGTITAGPVVTFSETYGTYRLRFETLGATTASVCAQGCVGDAAPTTRHELTLKNLSKPGTAYRYTVTTSAHVSQQFTLRTPPAAGSRRPFTFAFTSDSREGIESGERALSGVNAYMMKRIAALVHSRQPAFFQFTGDMIDGYGSSAAMQRAQYGSWYRAIWPLGATTAVQTAMGNHEALVAAYDDGSRYGLTVDRFPFATHSAEAIYGEMVANPHNGPLSEDDSAYDPTPAPMDFPSYDENVYAYSWDNAAMLVLNTNYWYSPAVQHDNCLVGGNPHGYLMDNQIAWLASTLDRLESSAAIDHVFITMHTPAWPNGGHIHDDMFYSGKNTIRPCIATPSGKKVFAAEGIIERRDRLWRILQSHPKVLAVLTGDEHNYARLHVKPGMPLYPEAGFHPDEPLQITRPIWQIHDGAAGAPYYALQTTPWNRDFNRTTGSGTYLKNFTTQNAVVFFHVDGPRVSIETVNPLTLLPIDEAVLRE